MKILMIDDDKDCLEALASFVGRLGHDTVTYWLPEKALEAYKREYYDVVITDLRMPRFNGFQVLVNILSCNPRAKVIIISGSGRDESCRGAFAHLDKPVDLFKLRDILEYIAGSN